MRITSGIFDFIFNPLNISRPWLVSEYHKSNRMEADKELRDMKKILIILLCTMLATPVYASKGYQINGWQLRTFLCNMGLGWNCSFEPPCAWKPCNK
jgi:hypothetical protein